MLWKLHWDRPLNNKFCNSLLYVTLHSFLCDIIVLIRNSPAFIMWLKILLRLGNLGAFHHNLGLFLRWFCSLNLTTFPLWMIFAEFPKCNSTISNKTHAHAHLTIPTAYAKKHLCDGTSHISCEIKHPLPLNLFKWASEDRGVSLWSLPPRQAFSLSSGIKSSIERVCLFARCPRTHVTLHSLICGSIIKNFWRRHCLLGSRRQQKEKPKERKKRLPFFSSVGKWCRGGD